MKDAPGGWGLIRPPLSVRGGRAVSGAGAWGLYELDLQIKAYANGQVVVKEKFPHPIVNNLFSHNSKVGDNGYNEEENKMVNETRKIFGDPKIMVTATCVRVPVPRAHSESINLEFERPMTPEQVREVLRKAPGVRVVDDRENNHFPMPLEASGQASPPRHDASSSRAGKAAAGLGALGLLLWKLKFLVVALLTKGKLLLLGLTKGGTLISMFASIGLYGTAWGWPFAAGFVALIYVHEMGHVAALSRYGIRASAPMFLPGIGAVVRLRQRLVSAREEAVVGLAGPIWGTSATLVVYAASVVSHHPILIVLSRAGALLNLFNLAPIWQLDGARAFGALRRSQRWMIVVAAVLAELATGQPLLFVIAILGMLRALERNAPARGDRRIFLAFIALICVLAALCLPTVDPAHTFR